MIYFFISFIFVFSCLLLYIYIYRERERERDTYIHFIYSLPFLLIVKTTVLSMCFIWHNVYHRKYSSICSQYVSVERFWWHNLDHGLDFDASYDVTTPHLTTNRTFQCFMRLWCSCFSWNHDDPFWDLNWDVWALKLVRWVSESSGSQPPVSWDLMQHPCVCKHTISTHTHVH